MAKTNKGDQFAKFKAGDAVILKVTCGNTDYNRNFYRKGNKFIIRTGPYFFTDNGGLPTTYSRHAFYKMVGDNEHVPQDCLEPVNKDIFDDLEPVGISA